MSNTNAPQQFSGMLQSRSASRTHCERKEPTLAFELDSVGHRACESGDHESNSRTPVGQQQLVAVQTSPTENSAAVTGNVVALARHVHKTRLRSNEILGARVLSDPQFEMLLELFVAHHEQRRICIGDLCRAGNVPATTGLRHIEKLEKKGFLTRFVDQRDARRWWVVPTAKALERTAELMTEFSKGH